MEFTCGIGYLDHRGKVCNVKSALKSGVRKALGNVVSCYFSGFIHVYQYLAVRNGLGTLPLRGHLALSGDIFGCPNLREASVVSKSQGCC